MSAAQFPPDHRQRLQALETGRSFIVQAPAGSGKTELLIQRILALLGSVRQPEEVLALTFTRKAAAEMRQRLLLALRDAGRDLPVGAEHARLTRELARRALEQDRRQGWQLLANPARLQLQTIDGFCSRLIRRLPLLAGPGAGVPVAEDPRPLYHEALGRLLEQLNRRGPATRAIERLLEHLDNRVDLLRDLLADMLARRDQWLRHLLDQRRSAPRQLLEQNLQRYVKDRLLELDGLLPRPLREQLTGLAIYAATQIEATGTSGELAWFRGAQRFPEAVAADLPGWLALSELLLTQKGELRRSVTVRQGFPPKDNGQKQRMQQLLDELAGESTLINLLAAARQLPGTVYQDREWTLLEALIDLLPLAVIELEAVFAELRQTDFIAVAGAARAALGSAEAPEELLLQLDSRISHLLVDEFQDTSYGQYLLLELLTSGWQPDDGRTLFVVGDPMQSIYRFREAEVGLYLRARNQGLGQLHLEPLQLSSNFRSQGTLVDWFNRTFQGLFPRQEDEARGAVTFAPADAARPDLEGPAVRCFAYAERQDLAEAEQVVTLVHEALAEHPQGQVAILARARTHLVAISAALHKAGIRFSAQEIVPLSRRPVVSDLRALTRALLHPGDRVAWLSVLRAPWCGLLLDDLLWLCEVSPQAAVIDLLEAGQRQRELFTEPTDDSRQRLGRVSAILRQGLNRKGRVPLRRLVESTWLELGGPACADAAEFDDAGQYFTLLERLDEGGELVRLEALDEGLERLYAAPDPRADSRVQLLTIHKSKGLEFDTVILPGLGRAVPPRERTLLRWLEHPDYELLLAPLPAVGGASDGQTYQAIGRLLLDKDELESLRLLYVAVTRARRRLCLLGHLSGSGDSWSPARGSLLLHAWPAVQGYFAEQLALADAVEPPGEPPGEPVPLTLRRLPADYRLPDFAESAVGDSRRTVTASGSSQLQPEYRRFALESETGRLVGQVVHHWLERFADGEFRAWARSAGPLLAELVSSDLGALGVALRQLPDYTAKVLVALDNALNGRHAGWLFDGSAGSAELALSGVLDGQRVQAVIDRTFVDEQQQRWVVDYKTSEPTAGEATEEFLQRESERYRPQLQIYARLLALLEPDVPVRSGLFFPLLDLFQELTLDEPDHATT